MIRVFAVVLAVECRKRKIDTTPTFREKELMGPGPRHSQLLSPDFEAFVVG